jgi:hypothetical protein
MEAFSMTYPLEPGGARDYPVKLGSILLTLVDPNRGFEKAYNRWYERDHFYAGCLVGPYLFAGSRWVATRALKDLRWPHSDTVADPWDAGSYVAIYWVEKGHHTEQFDDWAVPQVHWLYGNGRGFPERTHVHTVLFNHIDAVYRDEDPVPVELALDHAYDGIVLIWLDGRDGRDAVRLQSDLAGELTPKLLAGSPIEIAASFTPRHPDQVNDSAPMPLGSPPGSTNRLLQMLFVQGDVREIVPAVRAYTDAVQATGLADTRLVAPFFRTVVGTDTYVDQLW